MPIDNPSLGCAGVSCSACATPNAFPGCTAGACAIAACYAGWLDCNNNPADGCEVDSLHDGSNCGGCGNACSSGETCAEGSCVATCSPPLTSCSGSCVNLLSDPQHCGACNTTCSVANSIASCSSGQCSYTSFTPACAPGHTACGSTCVDTNTDVYNCGGCGNRCVTGNSIGTCVGGQCQWPGGGTLICPYTCCGGFTESVSNDPQTQAYGCGGACSQVCGSGQYCNSGACAPLSNLSVVTGVAAGALAVDATRLYWVNLAAGTVSAAPKAGGATVQLASGQVKPVSVAVNSTTLYWANNLGGAIMSLTLPSGAPGVFATAGQPGVVVADDTAVVWWNAGDDTVRMVPAGGGATQTLYTAVSVSGSPTFKGLIMGATTVYLWWSGQPNLSFDPNGNLVTALPRSGAPPYFAATDPLGGSSNIDGIAADDTYLYVTYVNGSADLDEIYRYSDTTSELIYGWDYGYRGEVVHAANGVLYTNLLYKAPLCPVPIPYFDALIDNIPAPVATAWDAQYFYWSDGTSAISRSAL